MDDDESPKIVPLFQSTQNFLSIFKAGFKIILADPSHWQASMSSFYLYNTEEQLTFETISQLLTLL